MCGLRLPALTSAVFQNKSQQNRKGGPYFRMLNTSSRNNAPHYAMHTVGPQNGSRQSQMRAHGQTVDLLESYSLIAHFPSIFLKFPVLGPRYGSLTLSLQTFSGRSRWEQLKNMQSPPLTTISMLIVSSCYKTLYRKYRENINIMVLVLEGGEHKVCLKRPIPQAYIRGSIKQRP